jgi:hypothetical protein
MNAPAFQTEFERLGFAVLDQVLSPRELADLRIEVNRLLATSRHRGGVRNVLDKSPFLRAVATTGPPARLVKTVLPSARPTKLTIFDKTPHANWKVPWHQDLTITVRERHEVPGFGPWSTKDGLPHVQPPVDVLQQTLAIRLHLDDTPPSNGALRVLAGTHSMGRLSDDQISLLRDRLPETVCPVVAGGAMLMSPLLLHASSVSQTPSRRRVLHFEYSAAVLPEDLAWA